MNSILEIVNNIGIIAVTKKLHISCAESCTGGLISKYLTDLAGSSRFFDSSIVVYSNNSKISLLNVNKETLSRYGAVSEAVVKEMSAGLLKIVKQRRWVCLDLYNVGQNLKNLSCNFIRHENG